jgi:peroxiredoxin
MTHLINKHPQASLRGGVVLKTIALSFLGIYFSLASFAQQQVKGEFIGGQGKEILVGEHFGDNSRIVDTIITDETGRFEYLVDSNANKGLYRLYLNDRLWLDVILGFEDLSFQTVAAAPEQSLIIFEGKQNEALYNFYQIMDEKAEAKSVLQNFVANYPNQDKAMKSVKKQLKKIVKKEQDFLNKLKKNQSDAFVTDYLNFLYKQSFNTYVSGKREIKTNAFRNRDWNNPALLNSNAYAKGIIDFLMLYANPNAGQEQQEALFRMAIDTLFTFIPPETKVYDYAALYLMEGFEQYEMESVIMHVVQNYSDNCSQTETKLSNRIDFYRNFYNGAEIPDFILSRQNSEEIHFYELVEGITLLVFWSTDCPHCAQMNLALKEMYPEFHRKGIKIVSVSLDKDKGELSRYLKQSNLPWSVYADGKGWDSPIVETFHLYATPTMFLINENYRLIGKPMNLNQLVYLINQIQ